MSHATRRMLSRRATTAYRKRLARNPHTHPTVIERTAWLNRWREQFGIIAEVSSHPHDPHGSLLHPSVSPTDFVVIANAKTAPTRR